LNMQPYPLLELMQIHHPLSLSRHIAQDPSG
jgi:hypothetical protein